MILITGGAYSGKTEAARRLLGLAPEDFADGATCSREALMCAKAIRHLETFIRRTLARGGSVSELARDLTEQNPDAVVLVQEVGSGVIPMEQEERLYREAVGRVSAQLAQNAGLVYRVVCGIPVRIKGQEEL